MLSRRLFFEKRATVFGVKRFCMIRKLLPCSSRGVFAFARSPVSGRGRPSCGSGMSFTRSLEKIVATARKAAIFLDGGGSSGASLGVFHLLRGLDRSCLGHVR